MFNFKNNSATCGGGGTVGSAGGKDAARCEEAKRQRCKASIIHVILNSFQDLLVRCEFSLKILRHYCTSALRIILKISGNLNVSDTAATLPPHSSSLPKGARGQKDIPSLEGRGSKGEGENLPSSGTMCHLLSHRGEWIKEILKRVQDDINISLKRTYSHINLFTYSPYKKAAFTLAEVLVTLGIIGVVSAMTVPTLMQNHQRKVYVTQLHKIYNQLQQAALQYTNDRNALNLTEAGINSEDAAANFVKTYFNVIQDCGTDQTPCFPSTGEYKKLSGATITTWYPKRHFVLADGTSLGTYYSLSNGAIVEFWVDTNGTKGPNIVGRDFFVMYMYNNGGLDDSAASIPMSKEQRETSFTNFCMSDSGSNYHGCFGKLLNDNWEMTY